MGNSLNLQSEIDSDTTEQSHSTNRAAEGEKAAIPIGTKGAGRPVNIELQRRRRSEILEVATRVFAEQGFAATDVQVIADQSGVGKGTVYRYFPTKEDLFLAAVDQGMQELSEAVDSAADAHTEPLSLISATIRAYLTFFDEHPNVVELLIHERAHFRDRKASTYFVHRDANIGPWRDLCQNLIDSGVFRNEPVDVLLNVISDLLYGTMFTNHFSGRKASLASQCDSILSVLFNGILVRPMEQPSREANPKSPTSR